ncbi:hypothetical protein GGX14DRAFT_638897, partial [Mycena pura]
SSVSTAISASKRPSLDRVASHSELCAPPPRTPSRHRNPHTQLWENMASSPIAPLAPLSSPLAREYVEFGRERRTRTLEWACARRRLAEKDGEVDVPKLFSGEEADVDFEEAVTPPGSAVRLQTGEPDGDMLKAALALCGL